MKQMKVLAGIALSVLGFFATAAFGQQRSPKQYTAKLAGTTILKEQDDKYNVLVYSLEMPEIEGGAESLKLDSIKNVSSAQFPRKRDPLQKKKTAALAPLVSTNFVADSNSGIPPDNYMAISTGKKAISVINQTVAVHDGVTGAYLYRKGLSFFSSAVGLNNVMHDYRFDPKVMYDPEADRFIAVMLNGVDGYNFIVVGFSNTNDPAGAWNFYKFYGNYTFDTTWFDYPAITITKNEFFITGNKIKNDSSWQAGFKQTLIYQINKRQGYNGDSVLNYQIWDSISYAGKNIRCLHPVKPGDALQGPDQYFLSDRNFDVSNDSIFLVRVSDTVGGASSLTVTPLVSPINYGVPPDARQPDTALTLATNDGRILGAFKRGDEIQFVNTSVYPATGSAAIYHGIISNVSGTPSITANFIQVDTLDMGYPNISFAGGATGSTSRSIISFNYSGPHTFPSFGAVYFDGSAYSPLTTVKQGDSTIRQLTDKQQRWGDYSGSQPEWDNLGIVWVEGIYGRRKNRSYGSYMARIISPDYAGVDHIVNRFESKLYPNPAFSFVNVEFNLPEAQLVAFAILDINGRVIDQMPSQYCKEGRNELQFNAGTLPSGTYFVRLTGPRGAFYSYRFIRN